MTNRLTLYAIFRRTPHFGSFFLHTQTYQNLVCTPNTFMCLHPKHVHLPIFDYTPIWVAKFIYFNWGSGGGRVVAGTPPIITTKLWSPVRIRGKTHEMNVFGVQTQKMNQNGGCDEKWHIMFSIFDTWKSN